MNSSDTDRLIARSQVGLAFFYGVIFIAMFAAMIAFWDKLTKVDVGLLTMFATGAMNQSKDAGNYFFARQRAPVPDTPPAPVTDLSAQVKPGGFK